MLTSDLLQLTIIGESEVMQHTRRLIRLIAAYDAPVLVRGETGTGKELVARGVHYCSQRKDAPLIPLNCGAFNDELFLSELFGYEKGAFTDAKHSRSGLLESANHGTLFLDEIDSLTPRAQVALLRFLQEGEYRPIGSDRIRSVDVRIIAASNKNLWEAVQQGGFREDLYYRLEVLAIHVPPLRERGADIRILSDYFLQRFSQQYRQTEKYLHPQTLAWFDQYAWPGNVRELENYLHRLFILSDAQQIHVPRIKADPQPVLLPKVRGSARSELGNFQSEKNRAVERFERAYIDAIMNECSGNVSRAARRAGKDRRVFGRLLKKYGIAREGYG